MGYESRDKDPDAVLDYQFDWHADPPDGPWLPEGDTITAATVTITAHTEAGAATPGVNDDDDTPVEIDSVSFDDTTVTAWISGGNIVYSPYVATCHVTTAGGRQDDRSLSLKIKER